MSEHKPTLYVAAGGGGDALAACIVAAADADVRPAVATFAWERKLFDPVPGPRRPSDFDHLAPAGRHNHRIGPNAHLRRRGSRTFIPELAHHTGASFFLIDPSRGAAGVRDQIAELTAMRSVSRVIVVDVGGDILARGTEPGLRSPLADALVLAGVTGLPNVEVDIVTIGLGLDGELSQPEWRRQVRDARPRERRRLPRTAVHGFQAYFEWFPSEATGLACLAALGVRGQAEIRGEGLRVELSSAQAYMHVFAAHDVFRHNRIAQAVAPTNSLTAADDALMHLGLDSELARERAVLARRASRPPAHQLPRSRLTALLERLLRYSDRAAERDIDFLTMRRVAEVLELRGGQLPALTDWLRLQHPERVRPPVWYTRAARDR